MTRFIIPLLILFALAGAAHAIGLGEGNRFGRMGSIAKKSTGGGGASTGFILMVDGSSRILQTDNTSKICRAAGC